MFNFEIDGEKQADQLRFELPEGFMQKPEAGDPVQASFIAVGIGGQFAAKGVRQTSPWDPSTLVAKAELVNAAGAVVASKSLTFGDFSQSAPPIPFDLKAGTYLVASPMPKGDHTLNIALRSTGMFMAADKFLALGSGANFLVNGEPFWNFVHKPQAWGDAWANHSFNIRGV